MAKAERKIWDWGLLKINGFGPHLIGWETRDCLDWISTPLVAFDPKAMTAVTSSRRPYRLMGPMATELTVERARSVLSQRYDLTGSAFEALSVDEALALMQERGNEFYEDADADDVIPEGLVSDLLIPDPVEDDVVIVDHPYPEPSIAITKAELSSGIARLMRGRGLTVDEAAAIANVEPGRLRGIVERGETRRTSIEKLDKIYGAILDWERDAERKP